MSPFETSTNRELLRKIVGVMFVGAGIYQTIAYTIQGRLFERNDVIVILVLLVIGGSFWQAEWIKDIILRIWPWGKKEGGTDA